MGWRINLGVLPNLADRAIRGGESALLRIDSMCADVTGKPDSALAMQPPYAAHAALQSPPLLPRRQYAPRTAIPVGVDMGGVSVAAQSTL